jgi:hypothetical protein
MSLSNFDKRLLPVTEFYHGCAKCKACIRLIRRVYYYDPETHGRIKEYERLRFHNSDRKAYLIEAQRRRRARYPEKSKQSALGKEVRTNRRESALFSESHWSVNLLSESAHKHSLSQNDARRFDCQGGQLGRFESAQEIVDRRLVGIPQLWGRARL